ncbi:DNA-binding transcriptional regulator, LysR family [Sphingobium faniae]|nr:DNA-binding transcriptional regulator, LysR family [Sphingobium faniae]
MNLRQLHHVVALSEYRNFGRAAESIGLTQSALTQSIRNLEEEFGVALFDRSGREVVATAFGMTVLHAARQTLRQMSGLRREIELMKSLKAGRLQVRCNAWAAEVLVGPALNHMLLGYPDLRFAVRSASSEQAIEELVAGEADIYVGLPLELPDNRIIWRDVMLPPLTLVCRPDHPLLKLKLPHASDCINYPIAVPRLPRWYADILSRSIGGPFDPDNRAIESFFVESDDFGIMRQLVRTTDLVTCMLPSMVADEVSRGLLSTITLPELGFPLRAVVGFAARRPLSPAGIVLLDELLAEAERLAETG